MAGIKAYSYPLIKAWPTVRSKIQMRVITFIGLMILSLSSCSSARLTLQTPGPMNGTVLNITDGQPLPGVYVVATASGHVSTFMSGYFTCYRTGIAITDKDGAFRMLDSFSNMPSTERIDSDWKSVSIRLFKPHFQTTEKSVYEDIHQYDKMLSSLGKAQSNDKRLLYMEPSNVNREQRLRYLYLISTRAACEPQGNPALLPFYQAIYSEAAGLAVSNYEHYLLDRIRYLIAVQSSPPTAVRKPTLPDNILITAVKSGNTSTVVNLLRTTPPEILSTMLNDRASDDQTALMSASAAGNYEMVKELVNAGADTNKVSFSGETALGLALKQLMQARVDKRGNESAFRNTVAALVESPNIDLNQVCIDGKTPLIYSVGGWYMALPDIFSLILEKGVDPNVEIGKATIYRQRVLGSVLDKEVHSSQSAGLPLLNALLASKKLDLNAIVFRNQTALIYMASSGRPDILKLLLDAGADPNVSIKPGITALGMAVQAAIMNSSREQYVQSVRILLNTNTIDVGMTAYHGKTAIELAKRAFRTDLIELLESKMRARPN